MSRRPRQAPSPGAWVLGILCASLVLAFAEPALLNLIGVRKVDHWALKADFGIPAVKWVRIPAPPGVPEAAADHVLRKPSIGLDFKCMDAHLRCAGPGLEIYGDTCSTNDPYGRNFRYPPLMAYAMSWSRWMPFQTALGLWSIFILAGVFAAAWALARAASRGPGVSGAGTTAPVQAALLLTLFYPVLFAFERGNNDVWVLLLYAAAMLFWHRGHWMTAGLCVGWSLMLKLYPAPLWIAAITVGAAGLWTDRRRATRWLAGLAAGVATVLIPLGRDYRFFLERYAADVGRYPVLRGSKDLDPALITEKTMISGSALDHAFLMSYGKWGWVLGGALWLAATAAWCVLAAGRGRMSDRRAHEWLAFAFVGALCTYLIPGTESFDYNLITAIPLAVCLLYMKPAGGGPLLAWGAGLWTLGVALPRWVNEFVFGFPERSFSALLVLQATGMILIAAYLVLAARILTGAKDTGRA